MVIPFILQRPLLTSAGVKAPATGLPIGSLWAKPKAAPRKAMPISITASQKPYAFIPCTVTSGGIFWMTRDEAKAILALPRDKAVQAILALAEKAEKYDQIVGVVSPATPSGMTSVYQAHPGQKKKASRQ